MATPIVLNGLEKTPYVLLERLNDVPTRDHTHRIPLADRNPVVLLERLRLDSTVLNGGEGEENKSRERSPPAASSQPSQPSPPAVPSTSQQDGRLDSPRDVRKRSLTPPPSTSSTPTKRVRFNSTGSEAPLAARRQLWTRLRQESVAPILKAKSGATKENLSVLLGVKTSRGVPTVSLERLDLGEIDLVARASSTCGAPTTHGHEDAEEEEPTSPLKTGETIGRRHRAAAACSDRSDNWSVLSLRI